MRIIAGDWGGRTLIAPAGPTRPTQDRVRQVLFDILGESVSRGPVLDLYAGSGALGLEALSRGAPEATFVEVSRTARIALDRNVRTLSAEPRSRIVGLPVRRALALLRKEGRVFAVVFADPPYGDAEAGAMLSVLGCETATCVDRDGWVVLEARFSDPAPISAGGLEKTRDRRVGDTMLHFYRPRSRPGRGVAAAE